MLTLEVNGDVHELAVELDATLLRVLRDQMALALGEPAAAAVA